VPKAGQEWSRKGYPATIEARLQRTIHSESWAHTESRRRPNGTRVPQHAVARVRCCRLRASSATRSCISRFTRLATSAVRDLGSCSRGYSLRRAPAADAVHHPHAQRLRPSPSAWPRGGRARCAPRCRPSRASAASSGSRSPARSVWTIGILNLVVLIDIARVARGLGHGRVSEEELEAQLLARGLMNRIFGRFLVVIRRSWRMCPLGFLLGLGFDTRERGRTARAVGRGGGQVNPDRGDPRAADPLRRGDDGD
jgi:hypothetical protein